MDIVQLVSNLGVPVTCMLLVLKMWREDRIESNERLESLTTALNNNTLVIQKLVDKIGGDEQ